VVAVAVAAAAVVAAVTAAVVVGIAVMTAAAVVVVAADKQMTQRPVPVSAPAPTERAEPQRPAELAEGTQPSPKVSSPNLAEGTNSEAPAFRPSPELVARATSVGEAWCQEYVRELHSQSRDIVGGWPGTLREARRRVLAYMPRNIEPLLLDELARITNLAARRGWESVSEPDLEP